MKKLAIIHISDLHLNPLNKLPISALENYHFVVRKEFEELGLKISNLKSSFEKIIVCVSGDIFNLKTQSLYYPKIIEYYSSLFENVFSNLDVFAIPGNHDLQNSSMSLFNESAYNIFVKSTKNIIDVSNKTISINDFVTISGIPYYPITEVRGLIKGLELDSNKTNVVMLHSDIFSSKKDAGWFLSDFIAFEEVTELNKNINLSLLGHIHKEMDAIKINNCWFSKPHAFSRMSKEYLSKENILNSFPSYSIVSFNDDYSVENISYERISLFKSDEFLDFNEIEKIKERSAKFSDFVSKIKDSFGSVEESFTIEDADKIYNSLPIEKKVKEIIDGYFNK